MDGAHNAQKMKAFIARYKELYPDQKAAILIGVKEGKEFLDLVPILQPIASRVITTSFTSSQDLPIKSMPADGLAAAFIQAGVKTKNVANLQAAYRLLLNCPESVLVVTGSFYLLGQIRE